MREDTTLTIFQPLKPTYITQHFGEANACVNNEGNVIGRSGNTCPAGYENLYTDRLNMKGHNGTDLGAYHSQPIYFPVKAYDKDGRKMEWEVLHRDDDAYSGKGIVIISRKPCKFHIAYLSDYGKQAEQYWANNGGVIYTKWTFWHNLKNDIDDTKGEPVKFGERIGQADNTGASSGDHVHFSMKLCDENGTTFDRDNGYKGAVNGEKLMVATPVVDHLDKIEDLTARQQIDRAIFHFRHIVKKN